jgi:hypothetical protein
VELKMTGNTIADLKAPEEIHTRPNCGQEIITVLVRVEDYKVLKKEGGPRPDQISLALRHYLQLIRETKWKPEMNSFRNAGGRVRTFRCAIPKMLRDEIRDLGGRFDAHTLEAVRLYLL